MHVIFGATGRVGEAAVGELLRRGEAVRAVVRDAARGERLVRSGCAVVVAQLEDPAAVQRAIRGATGVLVLCPLREAAEDLAAETQRVVEVLASALAAEPPRSIVALSDYGAQHPTGTGLAALFHRLEVGLSGLAGLTLLRSSEHMENVARLLPVARARGVWPSLHQPLDRQYPLVAARDVGVLAAELLRTPPTGRRVVHVEGPRRYSAREVAGLVGQHLGRAVEATAIPPERRVPALIAGGLGADYARLVAEMQAAHDAGRIEVEAGGELRRGTTDLAAVLHHL